MDCKHSMFCTILSVARDLLQSGLETLITDKIFSITPYHTLSKDSSHNIIEDSLFRLIFSVTLSSQIDIYRTLERLANVLNADLHEAVNTSRQDAFIDNRYEKLDKNGYSAHLNNCRIQYEDTSGRKLSTDQGIGSGIVICSEAPYALTICLECKCHDSILLVEHLITAASIHQYSHHNKVKFKYFKDNFVSCLPSLGTGASNSCSNLSLLVLVSALYSLCLHRKLFVEKGSEAIEFIHRDASIYFDILKRLPANTHAVTQVIETNTNQSNVTIESKRVALALFLTASSINHSCKPNSIIRYSFNKNISTTVSTNKAEVLLNSLRLEIVATESIFHSQEITVSYGPLYGKHGFALRQAALLKQYCFVCSCQACLSEKEMTVRKSVEGKKPVKGARFVEALCHKLKLLGSKLKEVNITLSGILNEVNMDDSVRNLLLQRCETDELIPVGRGLIEVGQGLYPELWSGLETLRTDYDYYKVEDEEISGDALWMELSGNYCMYLDIFAHLQSIQGKFKDAAEKVLLSINIMIKYGVYSENDVVIARERVKLASLLVSWGDLEKSIKQATLAFDVLKNFVSPSDPDLIEAGHIIKVSSSISTCK